MQRPTEALGVIWGSCYSLHPYAAQGSPVQESALLLRGEQPVLRDQHMLCDVDEELRCIELHRRHIQRSLPHTHLDDLVFRSHACNELPEETAYIINAHSGRGTE